MWQFLRLYVVIKNRVDKRYEQSRHLVAQCLALFAAAQSRPFGLSASGLPNYVPPCPLFNCYALRLQAHAAILNSATLL